MKKIQTKNKLHVQVRGLGAAPQPTVETDMAALSERELSSVTGGQFEPMNRGRTRTC
jgi:hypothetical protein